MHEKKQRVQVRCRMSGAVRLLLFSLSLGESLGFIQIPHGYKYTNLSKAPEVFNQPVSHTAFSLDDIHLPCEATGDPAPSFRWVKDGTQFGDVIQKSGTLTVEKWQELSFYQGTYRCYAANELGTAVSDLVHLITESVPNLAKERRTRIRSFEEGASAVLHCNPPKSSDIPKIHWMDKDLNHIRMNTRIITGLDGNLYFSNLLPSDSRNDYICNAYYTTAGIILPKEPITIRVSRSNSVVKNRRPQLHKPKGSHTSYVALRGKKLTLECIPEGLPTPDVVWERKDSPLSEDRAEKLNYDRWLQIRDVTEADDGEYTCTANNTLGSVTHYYTVTVEAAPYWTKQPEAHLYAPGETVRLDCQAEGIPTPNITWSINGVPLIGTDLDPRRRVSSGALILSDVQFSDSAVYQCEAANVHGHILINTYVHVIELPPQILTDDGLVYRTTAGQTTQLECQTFGLPRPSLDWEVSDASSVIANPKMSQLANGSLQISDAGEEDSGVYWCSVRDSDLSISAQLHVLNRTKIVEPPQDLWITRGKDAVLNCKFTVDQSLKSPTIQWKKDGHKISASASDDKYTIQYPEGSLKVTNVEMKDGGQYQCEISTELDSDMAKGSIIVQDKAGPPQSVDMSEQTGRSVTLSWTPGIPNNSPLTGYIIEIEEHQDGDKIQWRKHEKVPEDVTHLQIHLQPYCSYRFRVRAVNEIGASEPSHVTETYSTPAAKPDINPENCTTVSTDPDSMIITWKELERRQFNGPGFLYKVFWRKGRGREQHWMERSVMGPPFTVNNTGPFVHFEIKVQAVNDQGAGPEPLTQIGYSGEDVPMEAPSTVTVSELNKTAVLVRWSEVRRESLRGHLLGYKIFIERKGPRTLSHLAQQQHLSNTHRDPTDHRSVILVEGNKVEEVVSGLQSYSNYSLTITVFNSRGDGPHSEPHHFSTPEAAPGPISFLTFESPSETQLTLHWNAPDKPNGVLTGYLLQYQELVDDGSSPQLVEEIDPLTHWYTLGGLNPQSRYIFYLRARNAAGNGEPVIRHSATLLDGEPPSVINMTIGETWVNLSWVPGERHRNFGFSFRYLRKTVGGDWEESEVVNSTQGFYQLLGLNPGTHYYLSIPNTSSDWEFETKRPVTTQSQIETQGWFIGLISALVLLLLVLLVLCLIKRSKGGKYSVKDKEEGQNESGGCTMKDGEFGEYRSLESDNDKCSASQPSLDGQSKRSSNDSLADYGDSVDIQFNEDGSFIGQYSGRRDGNGHGGQESSGAASPINPMPPPSVGFPNPVVGISGTN